jgi:hypothetical protein
LGGVTCLDPEPSIAKFIQLKGIERLACRVVHTVLSLSQRESPTPWCIPVKVVEDGTVWSTKQIDTLSLTVCKPCPDQEGEGIARSDVARDCPEPLAVQHELNGCLSAPHVASGDHDESPGSVIVA